MDDYIKKSDAQDMVHLYAITVDKTGTLSSVLRNIIRDIPPADVRPVARGLWINLDMHNGMEQYKCSVCNQECYVPTCMGKPMYNYCPNCGADMRPEGGAEG